MIRLKTIIQHIVESYQLIIIREYDENRPVNRVDFLEREILPDPDTLYICSDEQLLKNAQMQTCLNSLSAPLMILSSSGEEFSFPLIQMSRMPDPQELFICINEKLKFESRLQQETNELYHLLYNGRGLDDIVRQAEQFLQHPISVLDASYSMTALSSTDRKSVV